MSETPEIDLTQAVEAAAKAFYEHHTNLLGGGKLPHWDDLDTIPKHRWRRATLSIVTAAMPDIARQAFDLGYRQAIDEYGTSAPWGGSEPTENPWAQDLDEEFRKLL